SIVWDDPADGVTKYSGVPQGYSVFINGTRVFTLDKLAHAVWNPGTGTVTLPEGGATVQFNTSMSGLQAPNQVVQGSTRMVDMFAKAGVDLTSTNTNLAQGASTSASFTASGTTTAAAVDGFTINDPIWGAAGSPNATDWYEINFGTARTVDEVRLYFRDSRPQSTTYRAPSSYQIQNLNGSTWTNVSNQVKTPAAPRPNYNNAHFTAVSTQRIRVQ